MRKFGILFLVAVATLVLVTAPTTAQESYPVVTEYAVRQSMDLGDPYSMTALVAMEKTVNAVHTTIFLADAGQLVNIEHPEGAAGHIVGEHVLYDPESTWDEVRADAEARAGGSMVMVYVGEQTLPANTPWVTTSNYWGVDVRVNTVGEPIDVPNSQWVWPSVPLGIDPVVCPASTSLCLYQAWDGLNGQRAWHLVMEPGQSFNPPFPMEGTLFQTSNVAVTDMPTLVSRFQQMVQEVIIRDDPDPADDTKNMVVFQIWVGQNPATGWTPVGSFDFGASVLETGVGASTTARDGARVRAEANTTSDILVVLPQGTAIIVLARDEQDLPWFRVRFGEDNREGWIRSDLVRLQDGFALDEIPVFSGG